MAGDGCHLQRLATTQKVFCPAPSRGIIRIVNADCGCAGHEDQQACRFNFRNIISTFMSITGWLKSGSFPRTLVLS